MQTCKCLNFRELVEVLERNKDGPSPPLLSRKSSLSVKENSVKKEKTLVVSRPSSND